MTPKVSVIIPVYNSEMHLRQCLDSVIHQTLKEIEIICIDDGSTDSSLRILKEYEAKDSRIVILTQENEYAGAARNKGISVAKGKYYVFWDSDDFFELNTLELEYLRLEKTNADICLCGADRFDMNTGVYQPTPWLLNLKEVKTEPFSCMDVQDIFGVTSPSPWSKMFSAKFIHMHNLRFQNLQRVNDLCFVYSALTLADRIVTIPNTCIHYRVGQSTNLQSGISATPDIACKALLGLKERIKDEMQWPHVRNSFSNFALGNIDYNMRLMESNPNAVNILATRCKNEYWDELGLTYLNETGCKNLDLYRKLQDKMEISPKVRPKVSVVIPIYNAENYLRTCIESVTAQTLHDIEIVCVNDGSTDSSLKIINEYASTDGRIVIMDKEQNQGLLVARKTGTIRATGKYIMFLDADAYLTPDACLIAWKQIEKENTDILQFSVGVEEHTGVPDTQTVRWLENYSESKNRSLNSADYMKELYITKSLPTSVVGKIYSTSLLEKAYSYIPSFNCFIWEDIFQSFYFSFLASKFARVKTTPIYICRRGLDVSNSASMSLEEFEKYCKMSALPEIIFSFIERNGETSELIKCKDAIALRMFNDCCKIFNTRIDERDKKAAAAMLMRYWTLDDFADEFERTCNISIQEFKKKYVPIREIEIVASAYSDNNSPKVSVIVPVYNTAQYVCECLDSIIAQSMQEIEVVCINDGSLDDSLSILERYAAQDARITVISVQNRGLSAARNRGIRAARGKYILFVDSDDKLSPDAIFELYTYAAEYDTDVLFFGADSFYSDNTLYKRFPNFDESYHYKVAPSGITVGSELFKLLVAMHEYRSSACLQFLKADFVWKNDILFIDGILHEDNPFTLQAILLAERCSRINKSYYFRRIRSDSIMTKNKSFDNTYGYFVGIIKMISFIQFNQFDEETNRCAKEFIQALWKNAKNEYANLTVQEKEKFTKMMPLEKMLFPVFFRNMPCDEASLIRAGASYRIGRFITFIPRKIRGVIRCYRDHGMRYTLREIKKKLGSLFKK